MEKNRKLKIINSLRILTYFLLPLLIVIGLLTNNEFLISEINSDLLYIVALYKDLFVDRYSILGWNLTPASYIFPDMIMFLPMLWIMPNIGYAFVLFSIVFFLLFLAIVSHIASFLRKNSFNCFVCVFSAGLFFVALVQDNNYTTIAQLFLFPSLHSGVILIGFILVAIFLNAIQKGYSKTSATVFFILSSLTIASDLLILTQFLLPLLITALFFYCLRLISVRTLFVTLGLIVSAQLTASAIWKAIELTGIFNIPLKTIPTKPQLYKLMSTLDRFLQDMNYYLNNNTSFFIIFTIFLVVSIIYLFKYRHYLFSRTNIQNTKLPSSNYLLLFLIIFSIVSIAIAVLAPIATGGWVDKSILRHAQPLFIFPLFFLALIFSSYNDSTAIWLKLVVVSSIVAFSLHQIVPRAIALDTAKLQLPYSAKVQCLDKLAKNYNLQYGYSDYWNAKYTTITSQAGLRVNQLKPDFTDFLNWINNSAWYSNTKGAIAQYPKYQFILTEGLPKAEIESRFGKPTVLTQCPGTEVYIYNRKSDIAFRNFLRIPAFLTLKKGLPSSIHSPENLRQYVPNWTLWNAPENIVLSENSEVSFDFSQPTTGEILEIAADGGDVYNVNFFMDRAYLGQLDVPKAPNGGIQARYLPLPNSLLKKPFNKIIIKPLQGGGTYSIGHIFIYDDSY